MFNVLVSLRRAWPGLMIPFAPGCSMHKIAAAIVLLLSLIVGATLPVSAQQQASPDPGVNPVRLLDRNDIRVTRVELAAGAVRSVHAHDDVEYHVWAPIGGTLEITIEKGTPTAAKPGQAFYMKKGTQHSFRNTGTTPAAVMEIFVKRSTTTADGRSMGAQMMALEATPENREAISSDRHSLDHAPAGPLAIAGPPFPDR